MSGAEAALAPRRATGHHADADLGDVDVPARFALQGRLLVAGGGVPAHTMVVVEPVGEGTDPTLRRSTLAEGVGRFRCPGVVGKRVRITAALPDA